jgi:hypothetical protein
MICTGCPVGFLLEYKIILATVGWAGTVAWIWKANRVSGGKTPWLMLARKTKK